MKVKITVSTITEVEPEEFQEINEDGIQGKLPEDHEILSYMRNLDLDSILEYFFSNNKNEIKIEESNER